MDPGTAVPYVDPGMQVPYVDPGTVVPYAGEGAVLEETMPMPEGTPPSEPANPDAAPEVNGQEGGGGK